MPELTFRKEYLNQWIAYFTLCCVLLTSQQPTKLQAETCPCILIDSEDAQRTRTATIVAGATLIALVGGVAYFAFGSGGSHSHKKHHHHYNYAPPFDDDHHHHHHHDSYYSRDSYGHNHHHHHHDHYSHYDYYSFFDGNNRNSFYENSDPQIYERNEEGNLPARNQHLTRLKKGKETDQISGMFMTHPSLSPSSKGNVTAFVQMPDGTTQVLGSLPFSASAGSSLSYGPFTQKGSYVFGICVDGGATLSSQTKVGSVEIQINGSTVESRDFFAPAHSPSHYEPHPCEYAL